ncbi:MAG: hypothetical protein EZS28_039986 [Streblomastix strix]|uniref:Uncharacterized protein n=1 Tax=Streblomastix strix TaxID=222440 RepID=A0A5J4U194_9EUKA|nr:MAG: hypothetical protein EZS28_039986 [Streblomastix strix]
MDNKPLNFSEDDLKQPRHDSNDPHHTPSDSQNVQKVTNQQPGKLLHLPFRQIFKIVGIGTGQVVIVPALIATELSELFRCTILLCRKQFHETMLDSTQKENE